MKSTRGLVPSPFSEIKLEALFITWWLPVICLFFASVSGAEKKAHREL